ncbi:purine-cytosine permease family protein [Bacillus sp. CHD6a]|uniref:purine-cytosine permease family protein n=1 Tax=Bacillus sp. CHD6a TaxID=1643452 RepID=UPI0006CD2EE1|nr:cytosine permease [Bacillus sp. CHD6a]KPB05409.1 cytosine permease [Bacillus sp. CHD6a]
MSKAQTVALPPQSRIERYGLEAVPQELRQTRWYEYSIIQVAFSVNAGNFLVPALAVIQGGLSFFAAFISTLFGATLAFLFVSYLSLPGAERGIPSQFAIRSIIGIKGSRYISSPIRTLTSLYWFSVQTIGGTLVIQFILERTFKLSLPFYIIAMLLAIIMSGLALVGFDAVKRATKYFMPWLILGQLVMIYLLITNGMSVDPPVKVEVGSDLPIMGFFASLAFVQYVSGVSSSSDVTRYAVTSRQGFWGLFVGNALGFILTAFFGAYTASLTGNLNPFIASSEMTNSGLLTAIILGAAILSMVSINLSNAYTGGFSLLNSFPRLGRVKSSLLFGTAGILLSLSPALVEEAEKYISFIGAFVIPLSAVIITDFLFIKRKKIDIAEVLPSYNSTAFICIGIGIGVYLLLPENLSPGFLAFLFTGVTYFYFLKKSQKQVPY